MKIPPENLIREYHVTEMFAAITFSLSPFFRVQQKFTPPVNPMYGYGPTYMFTRKSHFAGGKKNKVSLVNMSVKFFSF